MRMFGSVLQLFGIAVAAAGGWVLEPWVGLVLAGVGVFAVGYQLETQAGDG
jgi:hypothetical protein